MALHRDIFWIGRQWAVTGHGLQLIDQKLQGFFDIEAGKLWDDVVVERMRAKEWLNAADFDKALAGARARYPQVSEAAPPAEPVPAIAPIAPPVRPGKAEAPKPEQPAPPPLPAPVSAPEESIELSESAPSRFSLRFDGRGKFVRPWRVWMKG
ncbi:MAG: hypothetical protein PS018_01495 [bacterium]|nr:hypothetical protein [bacterium]